jgi:hypothetical protein
MNIQYLLLESDKIYKEIKMHNYSGMTDEEVMDDIVCPATIEMFKRMNETISKLRSRVHNLELINQNQQDM